ncbi:MAG: DnaJ domain-containing protein [Betaproteobacteria bacterium]|nr:DnaJ domain-containing protein [Betaproteobacteria bacterium]
MKTAEARKLLGVGQDATSQAIKRAFRHLAMLWHPDRNPAPEAHEMFARLSAACDLLLEPFGQETASDDKSSSTAGKAESRGADRNQDIELDIEQLCLGGKIDTVLESGVDCLECAGQGYQEHERSQLCVHCQGSGRVRHGKSLHRCENCDGRGYSRRIRCPQCDGRGRQISRRVLTVTIPPGMLPDDELRLKGEGYAPVSGKGRPGDLRLRIQCHSHPLYTLEGSDISLDRPVSVFILLGGGNISVPSPNGLHDLDIEPGSASMREQDIPGAGIPARGKRAAGKLRVRLVPVFPASPTPALLKLYRALQAETEQMGTEALPELVAWERRWLPGSKV